MNLQQKLVSIATAQIGNHESGGNNKGPEIVKYQQATWLKPDAWAWCAAFCCWVLREWLKDQEVQAHFKLAGQNYVESWRCRDASAYGWEPWGAKHGALILSENDLARAGDFVTYDFSHIGLVSRDQEQGEMAIHTIEGNSRPGSISRESSSGDGVWAHVRDHHLARHYIRLIK